MPRVFPPAVRRPSSFAFLLGLLLAASALPAPARSADERRSFPVVDTAQVFAYDAARAIADPVPGAAFFGQDAQYVGAEPHYELRGTDVAYDTVSGLSWTRDPGEKRAFAEAVAGAAKCRAGGHRDWRLPTIKELYSLIRFDGTDPDPRAGTTEALRPFIDRDVFAFRYGDPARGERVIDAQYASSTKYVSTTMAGDDTVFGVNFADGRIKGYGLRDPRGRGEKRFFILYVRGNRRYGTNDFHDLGDGTIEDRATGLVWTKADSGGLHAGPQRDGRLLWEEALAWAEDLELAGHDDWRLPNAKELQSVVDYMRSPDTTHSAAIDPHFDTSSIENEGGQADYPCFWTSTTHATPFGGETAAYVAFGRALGWMPDRRGGVRLLDVHGAGSQRSDPKQGDAGAFPRGRGPQGDVIRIRNFARAVRGGGVRLRKAGRQPTPAARAPGGRKGPPPGGAWVRRLDRDGDGRVSRAEFDGPPEQFDAFDLDGDGFIGADEAPRGPPPGGRRPPR
jgi:hypothetical protein